jgi:hypothetical protein
MSQKFLRSGYLIVFGLSVLFACEPEKYPVQLNIKVENSDSEVVDQATIKVDGLALGSTNHLGQWEGSFQSALGEKRKIEISKESRDYYFAPYVESFSLDDPTNKKIAINARLYYVAKPSLKDSNHDEKVLLTDEAPTHQISEVGRSIEVQQYLSLK